MSDEEALLAAIAAHPDEDTSRLAYADWLDEHDRPVRAEFIRVQVEIAQKQETLTRVELDEHVELFRRNQELIDKHRDEFLGPLTALPAETLIDFWRGFVSDVTVGAYAFFKHRHLLATLSPLPRIVIGTNTVGMRDVLGFNPRYVFPDSMTHIVAAICPDSLDYYNFDEDLAFRDDVARGEVNLHQFSWPRLDKLNLSGCGLGDVLATALLRSEAFPLLSDLAVPHNNLTEVGVSALLNSGLPHQLKGLDLEGNPIGDAGAIALAEGWPMGDDDKLEYLNLRFTDIGQPGQQALTARFGGRLVLF